MVVPAAFGSTHNSDLSTSRDQKLLSKEGHFVKSQGKLFHVTVEQYAIFGSAEPVGRQFASDRIAPKSNAPLYKATSYRQSIHYTPLNLFESAIIRLRKEQIAKVKADEQFEKNIQLAEAMLTLASLAFAPVFALGALEVVETLITIGEFGVIGAKLTTGDQSGWCDLAKTGTLEFLQSKGVSCFLPMWSQLCLDLETYLELGVDELQSKCCGRVAKSSGGMLKPKVRVPADDILDQCFRFRCMAQPGFVKEVEQTEAMFKSLQKKGVIKSPAAPSSIPTIQQAPPYLLDKIRKN